MMKLLPLLLSLGSHVTFQERVSACAACAASLRRREAANEKKTEEPEQLETE